MGKKRSRQQSFNGVATGDSSESDGSQSHDKSPNLTRSCQHASKSIDQNLVRKQLHLEDLDNNNFCERCCKEGKSIEGEDIYVCLRCGAKACSLEHSKEHNVVPRSDSHALSLKLSNKTVWCHGCALEIDVSTNRKLKACVNNVESMYEKHLQGPTTHQKSTPKIETIAEEPSTENNKLEAIPLLPPKIKTQSGNGVKGLWNLGNTCFFNSVLQCLAQTPQLIETLREMEAVNQEVSIKLKDGRELSGTLEKQDNLCEELAETLFNIKCGGSSFSPSKLLNILRRKVPQFKGNDQHDAHELLRHLLESVRCSDLKRYRKLMLNELGLNGVELEKVDAEKQKELKQLDREVTEMIMLVPDQVFRGSLVSRLECQECQHSSECVETFLDLSLPVTSEKPHPPSHIRRKTHGNSPEEKGGSQMSKHQLKKERKLERKKNRKHHPSHPKKNEMGHGEGIPSISEKGESDPDGEDGDVDSEGSEKKTELITDNGFKDDMLCAGFPIPAGYVPLPTKNCSNDSGHLTHQRPREVPRNGVIPLTDDGLPDISKLNINDSSLPDLKVYIRDSATISKEEPSWHSNLHEFPEALSVCSPLANDNVNDDASKTVKSNEVQENSKEKQEKEEEISSDDRTIVGDTSGDPKDDSFESRLADVSSDLLLNSSDAIPALWDEETARSYKNNSEPLAIEDKPNDEGGNSDDEVMVGSLFDESNSSETGECTIQTCLAQFTGIEMMTGSNKVGCEKCTARANKGDKDGKTVYTMSTKQLLIAEAPPVLILHIKRFQVQMSSFRKLSRHVAFPLELDISPFCKVETVKKSPKKLVYNLYGIVEHSGNFSGGHYVAYVKVENSKWFCVSDSYVNEVKESRVLQAQAYLLFYKLS